MYLPAAWHCETGTKRGLESNMADRKMENLRRMPIFSRCSKKELESVAMNTDEVDIEAGRTLIEQGHPNHTFYVLLKGEVEVDIQGESPRYLGPGDFFGEITMIDPGPATATVVTRSPVKALVMSHTQFHSAIRADEMIALRVMAVMAERLRQNSATGSAG
jgi:CRP-like cAMP-binding protein